MYGWDNPEVRTTEDGETVGPRMHRAVVSVSATGPYPSKNQLAKSVGPNGSQDYGYRVVNRCVKKGLLEIEPDHPDATPNGRGAVVITEKGKQYLSQHSGDSQ